MRAKTNARNKKLLNIQQRWDEMRHEMNESEKNTLTHSQKRQRHVERSVILKWMQTCTHLRVAWRSSETSQILLEKNVSTWKRVGERASKRTSEQTFARFTLTAPLLGDNSHSPSLFIWFIIFLLAFTRKIASQNVEICLLSAFARESFIFHTHRQAREKNRYAFSILPSFFSGWALGSFIL